MDVNEQFLATTLDNLETSTLLSNKVKANVRLIFQQAVTKLSSKDQDDADIARKVHIAQTLIVLLQHAYAKKWTSTDIINLFTGLDKADDLWSLLVIALDHCIRHESSLQLREYGLQLALTMVSGANQGPLNVYFMQRDLFVSIVEVINDPRTIHLTHKATVLLGLLLNYNKFEMRNPYVTRIADYVNDTVMKRIVTVFGETCAQARDLYAGAGSEEDPSYLNSLVSTFSLTTFFAQRETDVESFAGFASLPPNSVVILLTLYEFINRNKALTVCLVKEQMFDEEESRSKGANTPQVIPEPPFVAFLSLASYILQQPNRVARATVYAKLCLIMLSILSEDLSVCQLLFQDGTPVAVRICRQRRPALPLVRESRPLASTFLDIVTAFIMHNLSKKAFHVDLYLYALGIIQQLISFQIKSRIRLAYHYTETWKSLISLLKYVTANIDDLKFINGITSVLERTINIFNLAVTFGDTFLEDPRSLDDVFYEIVRNQEVFAMVGSMIGSKVVGDEEPLSPVLRPSHPVNVTNLRAIYSQYLPKIEEWKSARKSITAAQILSIIRDNYDSLELVSLNVEKPQPYKEANEKDYMRQVSWTAFTDAV